MGRTNEDTEPLRKACSRLSSKALTAILGLDISTPTRWSKCPRNDDRTWNLSHVVKWLIEREREVHADKTVDDNGLREQRRVRTARERLRLDVERSRLLDAEAAINSFRRFQADAKSLLESLPEAIVLLIGDRETQGAVLEESRRIVSDAVRVIGAAEVSFYEDTARASLEAMDDADSGVDADEADPSGRVGNDQHPLQSA